MTGPPPLVHALHSYDLRLRLRWCEVAEEWWIEVPEARADPELVRALESDYRLQLDLLLKNAPERHAIARRIEAARAARDGYRGIMFIPRDCIHDTDRIMRALIESDCAKQGTKEGVNRLYDHAAERFYVERDKARRAFVEAGSRDMYDRIAWLSGRRVTTSDMAAGAEPVDSVERHEGFTVRVRTGRHRDVA